MIVKKYLVDKLEDAEALIRRDLGPDAVILTSRPINYKGLKSWLFSNKIEIVAAVEEDREAQPFEDYVKEEKPSTVESSISQEEASQEWESPIQVLTEETRVMEGGLTEPLEYEHSHIPGTYLDPRFNRKQNAEKMETPPIVKREIEDPCVQIHRLKAVSDSLKEHFKDRIPQKEGDAAEALMEETKRASIKSNFENGALIQYKELIFYLLSVGLSHSNAVLILKNLIARHGSALCENRTLDRPLKNLLKKEIANLLSVSGPICLTKNGSRKIAFIGLSGSGKTTALMSIGAQYVEELEKNVAVISYMPNKIGEEEQIRQLCSEVPIPLSIASNQEQLISAIDEYSSYDLVLIDTPGFGFILNELMQQTYKDFGTIKNLEVCLVISANTKDGDAIHLTKNLSSFDPKSLIFTKLDETHSLGLLLNVSNEAQLPIGYLTKGSHIPIGLQVADPDAMARLILKDEQKLS